MPKKERKLSQAEQERKAEFESVSAKLLEDGYKRTDLTVGVVKANVISLFVMLPFIAASFLAFYFANRSAEIDTSFTMLGYFGFLIGIIVLAVVHELIHGLTWGAFAEGHFKSIRFGVIWKMLTPYCACLKPLRKWQYVLGSAMPTVIIGIGLTAAAAAAGSCGLELLAVVLIAGGGGDLLIIIKALGYKSQGGDVLLYDHPYECGVVAFEKTE